MTKVFCGDYYSWANAPNLKGYDAGVAPPGLEANWYKFDNCNNGSEIDYGSSAVNLSGINIQLWAAGKIGSAVAMPGGVDGGSSLTNVDFFTVNNVSSWANDISGAFAAWVYLGAYQLPLANRCIWGFMKAGSFAGTGTFMQCYVTYEGRINHKLYFNNSRQYEVITNVATIPLNTWKHVVVTHNGVTPAIYVNGVAQSLTWVDQTNKTRWLKSIITDSVPATAADSFHVGLDLVNKTVYNPWSGLIDDLRYYRKPLTDAEIVWLQNSGNGQSTALTF